MKKFLSFALCLVLVLGMVGCGGKGGASSGAWQEQYDLGIRYLSEGNYQEAILAFTEAIQIDPKQADLYIGRAEAYLRTGETAETLASALADYEAALDIDSGLATGWLGLADVYIRMGDYEKALEVLKEALAKTDSDPAVADKIAELESGNVSDAFGQRRRTSYYDGEGVLRSYFIYTYNEQGKQASITGFDAEGNQGGHLDFTYNEAGKRLVDVWAWGYDGSVWKREYEYDAAGNRVKTLDYDEGGQLEKYSLLIRDETGKLIREDQYGLDDKLRRSFVLEYNDQGKVTCMQEFGADGALKGVSRYAYDENGNRVSQHNYDKDGQLTGYIHFMFDDAGKLVAQERYDGDGSLTDRTTSNDE